MPVRARDMMTGAVVTASPSMTVAEIAALLADEGISAVPVCDKAGRLLGMISEGDLLRPFTTANALRREWWLGLLSEGDEVGRDFLDYIRLDRRQARQLMTTSVVTVTLDATAPEIAGTLGRNRIKRVPVVENGRLVGIVSRADLLRELASAPQAMAETR